MKKYSKINTIYKRFQFKSDDCPNKKWLVFKNKIILGEFSDKVAEYLSENNWEAYSKIDGTNCKIAYFPSTGEIRVEGKDENSNDQQGMFAHLTEIGNRIQPKLTELFPKESARFTPVIDKETKKPVYRTMTGELVTEVTEGGNYSVELVEQPIYIYGEYFGKGIQKCGKRYLSDSNDFLVFDINQQGWWIPKEVRDRLCNDLGLKQVPFVGVMTLKEAENMVRKGFTTKYENAADKTLIEEGLVIRPTIPLFSNGNNRIIVKIKYCDYAEFDKIMKEFTLNEYYDFLRWYAKYDKEQQELKLQQCLQD